MKSSSGPGHAGPATAMVVIGALSVVAGGLIAAITGPLGLAHGSWLAAYLVLVCGVGQFAIGTVEFGHRGGTEPIPRGRGWIQLVCLNAGNAAVIVGTLTRDPLIVDVSVVLLLVAFGIALHGARVTAAHSLGALAGFSADSWAARLLMWVYRILLVLLVVSLPVGAVLAHLRAG